MWRRRRKCPSPWREESPQPECRRRLSFADVSRVFLLLEEFRRRGSSTHDGLSTQGLIDPSRSTALFDVGATGCGRGLLSRPTRSQGMVSFATSLFYDRQMTMK